jgi:uncharacterized membrane protein (UPF0127 family)
LHATIPQIDSVVINGVDIRVDIANDEESWYKGLSNRDKICRNCGMLFIFSNRSERTFVMREMRFPLDIIWIDRDKIVKIDKNTAPEGKEYLHEYHSPSPVNYVLEVNAGFAEKQGFKLGDKVLIETVK